MLKSLKNSTAYRYLQRSLLLKSFLLFLGVGLLLCGLTVALIFGLAPLFPAVAVAAGFIAGKSIASMILASTIASSIYSTVCSLITKAIDLIKFPANPNSFFSRIMGHLGYIKTEGVCNGASHVMMQAYLTSKSNFKHTHNKLLKLYNDNSEEVIKARLNNPHKKRKLEQLFNRISIFQSTEDYLKPILREGLEVDPQDAKVALHFAETNKIKTKGGIFYAKESSFVGQYTVADLKIYLRSFKRIALRAPKIALTLGASRHSTMLHYDKHKDIFLLFDINHEKLIFEGSAQEIAKCLYDCYDSKNSRITMATHIFHLKKHTMQASIAIYKWKSSPEWKQLHQVNNEMLTSDLTTNEDDQVNHSIFAKALIISDLDMLEKITRAHLNNGTRPTSIPKDKWERFTEDFIDQSPDTGSLRPGLSH